MKARTNILFPVAIVAVSFLVYANSVFNDFVWDDRELVKENIRIREIANFPSIFQTGYWDTGKPVVDPRGSYRPLTVSSYLMNYVITGAGPAGFRLLNILLHALNSVLVFFVARYFRASTWPAFSSACLFAVHPVHVESVAWISGRPEVLAALFLLLSFLLFGWFYRNRRLYVLILSCLLYGAALLSKESAISFPAVILLYMILCADHPWKKRLRQAVAHSLPYIAIAGCYLFTRFSILGMLRDPDAVYFPGIPALGVFQVMTKVCAFYWKILTFPIELRAHYDLVDFPIPVSFLDPQFLISMMFHLVFLTAIGFSIFRKKCVFSFYSLWVYVALLPYMHIVPFQWLAAERFLYIPSIGFCLLVVHTGNELLSYFEDRSVQRWFTICVFILILILLSVRTLYRNRDWKNEIVFFEKMVNQEPTLAPAHANLGRALFESGDYDGAIREYETAVQLRPDYAEARATLNFIRAMRRLQDESGKKE